MRVRFLADADLKKTIITGVLRTEPSRHFETALHAGLRGRNDQEVLSLAADRGRILVSHDVNTMPAAFADFLRAGGSSPGVFLVHQDLVVSSAIEELFLIWSASDAEEWKNRLEWLPL